VRSSIDVHLESSHIVHGSVVIFSVANAELQRMWIVIHAAIARCLDHDLEHAVSA
jgi:hypothetical protein